jgi:hypothetical protein
MDGTFYRRLYFFGTKYQRQIHRLFLGEDSGTSVAKFAGFPALAIRLACMV